MSFLLNHQKFDLLLLTFMWLAMIALTVYALATGNKDFIVWTLSGTAGIAGTITGLVTGRKNSETSIERSTVNVSTEPKQ